MKRTLDWLLEKSRVKRPPEDPNAPRYGEVLDRVVAAGIDIYFLYLIFNRVFQWMGAQFYRHIDQDLLTQAHEAPTASESFHLFVQSGALTMFFLNTAVQFVLLGLLIVGMQMIWQATPGKWLFGLKIVRRRTFAPVENWRYVVRFLGYIPAAAPLMLGIVWAQFNKERRGWHDMLAGTVVLQTRPKGWYWQQTKRGARWVKNKITSKNDAA